MSGGTGPLTPAERAELVRHEATIERGLRAFAETAEALWAIRERRLYRESHSSFKAYTRERWDFDDSRGRQLADAWPTVTAVTAAGLPAPANERVARVLVALDGDDERLRVWAEAVERHGAPDSTDVAAVVADVGEVALRERAARARRDAALRRLRGDFNGGFVTASARLDALACAEGGWEALSDERADALAAELGARLAAHDRLRRRSGSSTASEELERRAVDAGGWAALADDAHRDALVDGVADWAAARDAEHDRRAIERLGRDAAGLPGGPDRWPSSSPPGAPRWGRFAPWHEPTPETQKRRSLLLDALADVTVTAIIDRALDATAPTLRRELEADRASLVVETQALIEAFMSRLLGFRPVALPAPSIATGARSAGLAEHCVTDAPTNDTIVAPTRWTEDVA